MTSEKGAGSLFLTTMYPTPMVVDRLFSSNMGVEYTHPLFSDIDLALPAPKECCDGWDTRDRLPHVEIWCWRFDWQILKRASAKASPAAISYAGISTIVCRAMSGGLRGGTNTKYDYSAERIHTLWIPSFSPALGNAIPTYVSAPLSMKVGAFSSYRIT
ncbi:hypothetical protein BDQ17DRAFT_1345313 [Cyathus striatus]|nr:hypothetical protein BDQ17DRAFT_1345313 [Cyathus striatus]